MLKDIILIKSDMEKNHSFLRNWLSMVSNPRSNVVQVLQDRFQSKLDDSFSEEENPNRDKKVLYPSKNLRNENKGCPEVANEAGADKHYQDDDGKVFKGRITNGERQGRGVLSWKELETNEEVCVEGFYHQDVLVGNVLRITKGKCVKLKSSI